MNAREPENIELLLSAYVDDELTTAERDAVERRLATDAAARRLVDELRAVRSELRALPVVPAPAGLLDDVLAAIAPPAVANVRPARAAKLLIALAPWTVAAAALFVGILIGRQLNGVSSPASAERVAAPRLMAAPPAGDALPPSEGVATLAHNEAAPAADRERFRANVVRSVMPSDHWDARGAAALAAAPASPVVVGLDFNVSNALTGQSWRLPAQTPSEPAPAPVQAVIATRNLDEYHAALATLAQWQPAEDAALIAAAYDLNQEKGESADAALTERERALGRYSYGLTKASANDPVDVTFKVQSIELNDRISQLNGVSPDNVQLVLNVNAMDTDLLVQAAAPPAQQQLFYSYVDESAQRRAQSFDAGAADAVVRGVPGQPVDGSHRGRVVDNGAETDLDLATGRAALESQPAADRDDRRIAAGDIVGRRPESEDARRRAGERRDGWSRDTGFPRRPVTSPPHESVDASAGRGGGSGGAAQPATAPAEQPKAPGAAPASAPGSASASTALGGAAGIELKEVEPGRAELPGPPTPAESIRDQMPAQAGDELFLPTTMPATTQPLPAGNERDQEELRETAWRMLEARLGVPLRAPRAAPPDSVVTLRVVVLPPATNEAPASGPASAPASAPAVP